MFELLVQPTAVADDGVLDTSSVVDVPSVAFEGVTFRYTQDPSPAVEDVSFTGARVIAASQRHRLRHVPAGGAASANRPAASRRLSRRLRLDHVSA
ncbi:MAG: hypothetical protein S0880_36975 [Actinomycetota bacterium]|nr:hypothetical protein [Actinomycetota bacterium]